MFNDLTIDLLEPSQMVEKAHYEGDRLHQNLANLYEDARDELETFQTKFDLDEARSVFGNVSLDLNLIQGIIERALPAIVQARTKAERQSIANELNNRINDEIVEQIRNIEYGLEKISE